jgi:hypothetical protein
MINLGAPRWFLFVLRVPLLVGFIFVLSSAIRSVGLSPTESLSRWIVVVESGLLTFPAAMVATMFFMPLQSSVRSALFGWVLMRRKVLYAMHRVIAGWRALAFCTLFLVFGLTIAVVRTDARRRHSLAWWERVS